MDNKLLRHDLLHSNENLVTPRCCEDAGAGFVGRSLKNSRPVIFSQNEDFDIAHHSIIQYFKHIISPPPGGGGDFRDSSGFAALRIDMSCVRSHKRKRRKRLLKQIGRNIAGSLPISAETYANIYRYGSIPLCNRQPGNRSRPPFGRQRKRIRRSPKTCASYCGCAGYTKKAAVSFRKHTARHTAGESRRKAGFLYLFY